MARIRPENNFTTTLAASISTSDTTITLTQAPTQTRGFLVLEPNTSNFEIIKYTGVSGNQVTGVTRGLDPVNPENQAGNPSFARSHAAGRLVEMANATQYFEELMGIDDIETVTGLKTFANATAYPELDIYVAPTLDNQLAPKKYVDDTAVSGSPDADNTTKGIVFIGNQTEVDEGDDTNPNGTATNIVSASAHLDTQDRVVTTDYTYGATIAVGDVLYLDTADAKWKLADGAAASTADTTYGVALDAGLDNDTDKRVQIGGVATTVSGLTTAGLQYVGSTAGQVSDTPATYKKTVGFSVDGSSMLIHPVQRAQELAGNDATSAELDQALAGISGTVTAANLDVITAGPTSNADAQHTHSFKTLGFNADRSFYTYQIPINEDFTSNIGGWQLLAGNMNNSNSVKWADTNSGVGAVSHEILGTDASSNGTYNFSSLKDLHVEAYHAVPNIGSKNSEGGFYLTQSGAYNNFRDLTNTTTRGVGFISDDATGNWFAKTCDATNSTTTDLGISAVDWQALRIEFEPNVECRFYINNVLQTTINTTLPPIVNNGQVDVIVAFGSGTASGNSSAPQVSVEI